MSQRGLSVLDLAVILAVVVLLLLISVREFPRYEGRVATPPPTPSPVAED